MGSVFKGIPKELTLDLAAKYYIHYFIETGTHVGKTALWASNYFDFVYTVESNLAYYSRAQVTLVDCTNVKQYLGDSSIVLRDILKQVTGSALVWLDAHWSPDLIGNKPDKINPMGDEINILREDGRDHVILVDDVRLFETEGWPSLQNVTYNLGYNGRIVSIKDDVLISEPKRPLLR